MKGPPISCKRQLHAIAGRARSSLLDSRTDAWQRAGQIREFLVAVTKQHPEPDADLAKWLTWARNRAVSLEAGAVNTVLQLRQPPERTQWNARF